MKLNKERGEITLKDIITLAVLGGALYFVYSKGYFDGYLPEKYASTTVLKQEEEAGEQAPEGDAAAAKEAVRTKITRLDPGSYPQKVKLLKATEFEAIYNGRTAGKVVLDAGSMVKLLEVKEKEVVIEHVGARREVPIGDTDVIERIHAIVNMNGSEAKTPDGYQKMRWNGMNERIK